MNNDWGKDIPDWQQLEARVHSIWHTVAVELGLKRNNVPTRPEQIADVGTKLAYDRTDLALKRTYWATEQTLMAWIRTSLSMISFGFTLGKLGSALGDLEVRGSRHLGDLGVGKLAFFLVILGTLALLMAGIQHCIRVHDLSKQGLQHRPSLALLFATILTILGIVAFGDLVLTL